MAGSLLRFPNSRASQQQYVHELSSIYGRSFQIDDPDVALSADVEAYQKLRKDPKFAGPIDFRLTSVASCSWHMEPASDRDEDKAAARIFEEMLSGIRKFTAARRMLASGVLVGTSYAYVNGARRLKSLDGGPAREWWLPQTLDDIDKRRFRFKPRVRSSQDEPIRVDLEAWDVGRRKWKAISKAEDAALVRMVYQDREDRLGHGEGLVQTLYHYFWAKGVVWRDYMMGLKRWAQGLIHAKVKSRPGDTDKTNLDIVNEWLETLNVMQSQHALVHGEEDEIEVIDGGGAGQDMALEALQYIDEAISTCVLGSVRVTGGATDTGARAQAEVEQDSTDTIIQYDREQLDEALTLHLVTLCWNLNRPNLVQLGLGDAQMPRFVTSAEKREDPQSVATQVETLLRAGVELAKTEVHERIGWRQPREGEEVFTAPATAEPGALPFTEA